MYSQQPQTAPDEAPMCVECQRTRTDADGDYHPMQLFMRMRVGWYSGDDGEMCGECMAEIFRRQ